MPGDDDWGAAGDEEDLPENWRDEADVTCAECGDDVDLGPYCEACHERRKRRRTLRR